jgi:hypothetical protein
MTAGRDPLDQCPQCHAYALRWVDVDLTPPSGWVFECQACGFEFRRVEILSLGRPEAEWASS